MMSHLSVVAQAKLRPRFQLYKNQSLEISDKLLQEDVNLNIQQRP